MDRHFSTTWFTNYLPCLPTISTATIAEYSTMCIKSIRKTLLDFEHRTILLSPHSDFLKIHAAVLDE
jgi:hypothetical protein